MSKTKGVHPKYIGYIKYFLKLLLAKASDVFASNDFGIDSTRVPWLQVCGKRQRSGWNLPSAKPFWKLLDFNSVFYFLLCLFILMTASIKRDLSKRTIASPDFLGIMKRWSLAKLSLTFANFHLPPERIRWQRFRKSTSSRCKTDWNKEPLIAGHIRFNHLSNKADESNLLKQFESWFLRSMKLWIHWLQWISW